MREETRYSFRLSARVLLYAPYHMCVCVCVCVCVSNIVSASIFFPLGKMIGMVRLRTSFILVKPVLGDWQSSYRRCRKDEIVLRRAHIGHTHLTHSYILKKDPPPQCEHCQCILSVRHSLVECNHFDEKKENIFGDMRERDVVESFIFVFYLKQSVL